jgi:phosphoribosylformimino-5-aminoimidazole carboxamide ribonucleotide (ProFAR) isomerase
LQINLRKLDSITIDAESQTAVLGGGVRSQELLNTLLEAGFEGGELSGSLVYCDVKMLIQAKKLRVCAPALVF